MKTTSRAELRRLPARRTRRLAALLGCAALAAVLAACSSAGAAPPASGGGSPAGGSASVTIAKAVDTIGFTTVDVAKAKGYFAKAGLNVNEDLLSGSSTAFAALESGSVNFVCASSTALISAKTKGLPLEAVASLDYGVSLQLLVSDSWIKAHHMSPNQPLDTVMREMAGAKLGVISTTDLTYDHYMEQQAGVSNSQFTYINMDSQSAAISAVKYGEIDAFLLSPPSTYYAQSQGNAEVIATLHEVPELANMAYDILVVDTAWAKTHQSEVKAVATAMAEADNIMQGSPQAVLDTEKTHYPTMSTSILLDSLHNVTFTKNGEFTPAMWQESLKEYNQTSTSGPANVNVSASSGVWTNQYIQQSQLSG
jgi:NitT/TauT family transport system substrate-binding protein